MIDRFKNKTMIIGDCLVWIGCKNARGYGLYWYDGMSRLAHKYHYESNFSKVPKGKELDHLCMNPACVKLEHLEVVDHLENVRRWSRSITHCPKGHEYTSKNTYINPNFNGGKRCQKCHREKEAIRRRTKKEVIYG